MRLITTTVLLVAVILSPLPASAHQHNDWRAERCRYARLDGEKGFSTREVARTIECAVDHLGAVGGVDKALDVARCESGLQARIVSSNGMLGVYQFHPDTWRSVVGNRHKFIRRWGLSTNALNGRANTLLAATIFRSTWSPWSCA